MRLLLESGFKQRAVINGAATVNYFFSSQCSISTLKARYFSGDWSDFLAKMSQESTKYDVILTSETIYEESNYSKLLKIFEELLYYF